MTAASPNPSFPRSLRCRLKRLFKRHDPSLKEVLEEAIEEHEEQAQERLEPEEKVMLHNVLSFGDLTVGDIMVPRADIAAIAAATTLDELKAHITVQRHTRIPVYEDTLDHVLGFIHVKDLFSMLAGDAPFAVRSVIRNALFVPPSMKIIDLLVRMRHAGSHMAIVVDEYGGTDGLVTMEDLFEKIVGDIHDEHDSEDHEDRIARINETTFEVSARIRVERLEKALSLKLAVEEHSAEFDTLGGLIFSQLGRVPGRGEVIPYASGVRFEIVDADERRIRRVRVITA